MQVGFKLTMIVVGLLLAVLALEGALRLRHERELFESDLMHEQRLLGRALRPSIEKTWKVSGWEAARELVEQAQSGEREATIRLLSADQVSDEAVPLGALEQEHSTLVDRTGTRHSVTTWLSLAGPSNDSAVLELQEELVKTEQRLQKSAVRVAGTALVMLILAGLTAVVLGGQLVGRPIGKLAARAGRVAAGDLSPSPPTRRADEIGQLDRAIARMVDGLREAREHLQAEAHARAMAERRVRHGERLAALGTLAAGVAHELGTPLQVVSGRARMIEKSAGAASREARNAGLIIEQTARMERIVRQLLDLAHPPKHERTELALETAVSESGELMQPLATEKGCHLVMDTEISAKVYADRAQLAQVMNNLLENAVSATPTGGTIHVSLEGPVQATPPTGQRPSRNGYYLVRVADEGEGIDEENASRIFEPFYTTKDVGQGTGLGLSVAYGIARDHGGWIDVDDENQRGAALRFYLPAEANS